MSQNYDLKKQSFRGPEDRPYGLSIDPSTARTKQAHKDECEINGILQRFQLQGIIDHTAQYSPIYGDFGSGDEYTEQVMQIAKAQNMFNELPAKARAYFNHDPAQFLDYVQGDPNPELLHDLGLLAPGKTPPRPTAPPVKPDPPATEDETSAVTAQE